MNLNISEIIKDKTYGENDNFHPQKDSLTIILNTDKPIDTPVIFHTKDIIICGKNKGIVINIMPFCGILKLFFDDYKSYWYFPAEDIAYHESVALFTEKSHRKKATKQTAYQKKEGIFLPAGCKTLPLISPLFYYEDAKKQQAYIPFEDDILENKEKCMAYCLNVLSLAFDISS